MIIGIFSNCFLHNSKLPSTRCLSKQQVDKRSAVERYAFKAVVSCEL